jgi:hypothetical protein
MPHSHQPTTITPPSPVRNSCVTKNTQDQSKYPSGCTYSASTIQTSVTVPLVDWPNADANLFHAAEKVNVKRYVGIGLMWCVTRIVSHWLSRCPLHHGETRLCTSWPFSISFIANIARKRPDLNRDRPYQGLSRSLSGNCFRCEGATFALHGL